MDDSGAGSDGSEQQRRPWRETPATFRSKTAQAIGMQQVNPVRKSGPMHQQFRSLPASMGEFSAQCAIVFRC